MDNPYICVACESIVTIMYDKTHGQYLRKVCPKCGTYRWRAIDIGGKQMKEMVEEHKWYHVDELADMIGRSPGMVRYWVLRGTIPFYRIGGRVMFMDDDVSAIRMFVKLQGRRGVKKRGA